MQEQIGAKVIYSLKILSIAVSKLGQIQLPESATQSENWAPAAPTNVRAAEMLSSSESISAQKTAAAPDRKLQLRPEKLSLS